MDTLEFKPWVTIRYKYHENKHHNILPYLFLSTSPNETQRILFSTMLMALNILTLNKRKFFANKLWRATFLRHFYGLRSLIRYLLIITVTRSVLFHKKPAEVGLFVRPCLISVSLITLGRYGDR